MLNPNEMPLLKKSDCLYQGNPKVILFLAYKMYKIQGPFRRAIKAQEDKKMMETLRDMNT